MSRNQESCVCNAGTTAQCFKPKRGARYGDPISANLFILALKIIFLLIKQILASINGLNIFDHCYHYFAYADDTNFFLKDVYSIQKVVNSFHIFIWFSELKTNLSKYEIAGVSVLKGVKVAVFGLQYVDLSLDYIKILGTLLSYNKKLKEEKFLYDHS